MHFCQMVCLDTYFEVLCIGSTRKVQKLRVLQFTKSKVPKNIGTVKGKNNIYVFYVLQNMAN